MTKAKLKVLVAEDHPINQEIIKAILEHHGFYFKAVANGLQVIELLKHEHFDVILMDMEMPLMNGCETTEFIRKMEKSTGQHVKIIALTANRMEMDRQFCLDAGMDCFLIKPINPDVMIRMITSEKLAEECGAENNRIVDEAEQKIFNANDLNNRLIGQALPSTKIVTMFLNGIPHILDEIDDGLASDNLEQVARFAHKMGGAAAMLGAEKLAMIAEELESDARVGSLNTLAGLNAKLKTMVEILSVNLQKYVDDQN